MSAHGWSITYPRVIAFGARALAVPGRGNVLCASAVLPFSLADGDLLEPAEWYEAIRSWGGENAVPDSVAPLPGAELLLLGGVSPVTGDGRDCTVRCGAAGAELSLRADPDGKAGWGMGAEAAVWHETDNPEGRGGPGDQRRPLILDRNRSHRPVWLGSTSYLHPARQRHLGTPPEDSSGGWPADASGASFHDAHEAFWADGLFPGDPLRATGLVDGDIDVDLPPYRVDLVMCRQTDDEPLGGWYPVASRVHVVTVVAQAGVGAMLWRGSVDLGADIMGESVVALVAGLSDADAPDRDHEELADIATTRWVEPERSLDDRPLLPESLHDRVQTPFDPDPAGDVHAARVAAAQEWAVAETGLGENPFASGDGAHHDVLAQMREAAPGDEAPDLDKMGEIADEVLARSKKKHEEMGFDAESRPDQHASELRGDALEAELERRLSLPYQAPREVTIAENLERYPTGVDPAEMLERLASMRADSPEAPLYWPAFELAEAVRFGERLLERLEEGDLGRHIDVSGVQVGDPPETDPRLEAEPSEEDAFAWGGEKLPPMETPGTLGTLERRHMVRGRHFDGLLAEESGWRGILFEDCTFEGTSLAHGRMENCEFVRCTFERVNAAAAEFTDCLFEACVLKELAAADSIWRACTFRECHAEQALFSETGMRDVTFEGGDWLGVQLGEGLFVNVSLVGTALEDVTFSMVRTAHMLFERVSMHRVVALGRGFPMATFREVHIRGSAFSGCRFDDSVWEGTRVEESGLMNAILTDATFDADCELRRCDLTGAAFVGTSLVGARLVECTLTMSQWGGADATQAWFFGSMLRGVDFADARLAGAVFCDADINGAVFKPGETIGADFTGTVRGNAGD